jgi:ABC-type lipoprotein release transport system permease subunit
MMKSFIELKKIAFRNLARHKVKTFLTCAAIAVSVTVFIWMQSWIGGMTQESRRNIINYEMGAAKLQTKMYFEKKDEMPAYENFSGWERYAQILDEAGYHTAPRYTFSGTMYSTSATGAASAPLVVYAVDPEAEAKTLCWADYVDFGRCLKNGEFGVVLGSQTAEKLKVGIPTRLAAAELDELIASVAADNVNGVYGASTDFIRSCYQPMEAKAQFGESKEYAEERAKDRLVLKRNITAADKARLWNLLDATGRNDVRISTVIDYKMAPENIRKDKWDADFWPRLFPAEQAAVQAAYEYDDLLEAYMLLEGDPAKLDEVLRAMIRVDYSGAVRHVNQLIDAKVVGTVNSPDPATNFNAAYMPLDVLQGDAGMALEGRVTELLIRDKRLGAADMNSKIETKEAIRAALDAGLARQGEALGDDLDIFFWKEYVRDYLGYESMEAGSSHILSFLLFFLALIGISNTMLLAILERTKEIGMMRAMGMTGGQMIFTYMIEACFLGLIGSAAGIIAGCALNYPMVKYGFDFSEMAEKMGGNIGYRVAGNFRGMWDIPVIIGSGIAATALSSLMAFFPSRRAVKMEITESLRFE